MSLLDLPLELFFEVAGYLNTGSFVHLSATTRGVRETLQGEKLSWLVRNYLARHTKRLDVIKASNQLVLSHALIYVVRHYGYSRNIVQPFIKAGASFRNTPSGDFLSECVRKYPNPGRLKFAIQHDALVGVDAGDLADYLKAAIVHRGTCGGHVRILLQNASADDVTRAMDQLISEAGEWPYYWVYVKFLTDKGGRLSAPAREIVDAQTRWMANCPVNERPLRRRNISFISVLQIIQKTLHNPEFAAEILLPYAISLAQLSGGINGLLETALSRWAAVPLARYLIHHGASTDCVPCGRDRLPELVLSSKTCLSPRVDAIEFLLEQGISLDAVVNGRERHLENTFLLHGPSPEVERVEREHDITLAMIRGGLDALLAKCIFEPSEPGIRVDYLREHGATLEFSPAIHDHVARAFYEFGPGPRMQLLMNMGGCLDYGPGGIDSFLQNTYFRYGAGRRVDWLLEQGAVWYLDHLPLLRTAALPDYQMQLMLLEQQNKRRLLAQATGGIPNPAFQ